MRWSSVLAVAILLSGCHEQQPSSVELLRAYKSLPADQVSLLDFGADTITVSGTCAILTGFNKSNMPLQVATVVPSCTCTRVTFDKKLIGPDDSIRINAVFTKGFSGAAITVVGNLSGGQKTLFIKPLGFN